MRQQATSTFLRLGRRRFVLGSSWPVSRHPAAAPAAASPTAAIAKGVPRAWSRIADCPGLRLAQAAGFATKANNADDGEKEKEGDGGKAEQAEKKPEQAKSEESQEQKLVKEVNKLEQLLREKESLLEEKEDMIKELKNNVLRSYAELENYRERASREAESTRKFSIQAFSRALLDVADNLERAVAAVPEDFASKNPEEMKKHFQTVVEGVKMTEKLLVQVFKKYGVERYDPAGQPFDPNVHLAICQVTDPSKSPGTVANVFMPGYMLHERVLRPAEVSVVRAAEEEEAS